MHVLTPQQVESNILAREMSELLSEESDQSDAFVKHAQMHVMQRWRALEGVSVADTATPQDLAKVPSTRPRATPSARDASTPAATKAKDATVAADKAFVPNAEAAAFVPRGAGGDAEERAPFPPDPMPVHQRVTQRQRQGSETTEDEDEEGQHRFYFFQSEDGQPIYLSPLNTRCLTTVRHRGNKGGGLGGRGLG